MEKKEHKAATFIMLTFGGIFGIWATAALLGGLHRVDWQVTELVRQYMVASGMIQPLHTLVDFYTHIKGIEYLICVAFFVVFPIYFKYIEKRSPRVRTKISK